MLIGQPVTRHSGEVCRTQISRGSKSRNKVSVGEPAEGSLLVLQNNTTEPEMVQFRGQKSVRGEYNCI